MTIEVKIIGDDMGAVIADIEKMLAALRGSGMTDKQMETVQVTIAGPVLETLAEPADETPTTVADIVARLTEVYKLGTTETKARIVDWRNSHGLKYLKDLSDAHLASAVDLLKTLDA